MKLKDILNTFIATLVIFSSVHAQFQISGTIKNEDGVPLEGVSISLKGESQEAVTTEDGFYLIESLKEGAYEISTEFFGYDSQSMTFDLKTDKEINFVLYPTYFLQDGIDVKAIRANKKTPSTYTNIDKNMIQKINYGQDLPFLLQSTPSTVAFSEGGNGVGYTGFRIRGIDPTKINVTIDGIPINNPETHNVSWIRMPGMATSVNSMQIQRGVGSSSNGANAFGASINISSDQFNKNPYATRDNTLGSFTTFKNSVSAGTGYMKNKFSVDLRLSQIISNGYIDRASSDLKAYFGQIARRGKKSSLRLIIFGGKAKAYQTWQGTPESRLYNEHQGMLDYASRNNLTEDEKENLLNSGRTYNASTFADENETYQQTHYQLHYSHHFNKKWNMKTALFLTTGKGNVENYRPDDQFSTYGFIPLTVNGDSIKQMDMIRQKWLDNIFYGGVFNINYDNLKGLKVIIGGGLNQYSGKHYSKVVWGQYMQNNQKDEKYFENKGSKNSGDIYVKANYQVNKFNIFTDIQYRYADYSIEGLNEKGGQVQYRNQRAVYNFINPKAGIAYTFNQQHSIYASYGISNREPARTDYLEKTYDNAPIPELLFDLEVGYHLEYKNGFLNANIYHMNYRNQLVLSGAINETGNYTHINVDRSYRLGLELEGGYKIFKNLGITANFAINQSKINNFKEHIDHYDKNGDALPQKTIEHGTTDLAFAPSIIGGISINYAPITGLRISLMNKYVGKQYLDNTSNVTRSIDAYIVSRFDVAYSFTILGLKEVTIGARIDNLYNQMYVSNGYTNSYFQGDQRIQDNYYYPQAGITFLGRLILKF